MVLRGNNESPPGRERLGFVAAVREHFAFLLDFGFSEVEALPTIVRYRKGGLDLNVYHGRMSCEVGMQIGHEDEQFSIAELICTVDPVAAEELRAWTATTSGALATGVEKVAGLFRRYGQCALRDDPEFFEKLRSNRKSWGETYALEVLASQTRPKAEAAFREGRYREAAELYEKIAPALTPVEQKKLALARKRS